MAHHYRIVVIRTPSRDPRYIDATGFGLRVERDGAYFQYVVGLASGQQLELDHPGAAQRPGFWAAAARFVASRVPTLVRQGDIPVPDPDQAFDVRLPVHEILSTLAAGGEPGRPLVEGDVVLELDA